MPVDENNMAYAGIMPIAKIKWKCLYFTNKKQLLQNHRYVRKFIKIIEENHEEKWKYFIQLKRKILNKNYFFKLQMKD